MTYKSTKFLSETAIVRQNLSVATLKWNVLLHNFQHLVHMSKNPVKKVITDLQFKKKCVESVTGLPQRTATCTGPSSTANGRVSKQNRTCGCHPDSMVKADSHVAQTLQHLYKNGGYIYTGYGKNNSCQEWEKRLKNLYFPLMKTAAGYKSIYRRPRIRIPSTSSLIRVSALCT